MSTLRRAQGKQLPKLEGLEVTAQVLTTYMEVLLKELTSARKVHSLLMAMDTKPPQCVAALEKLDTAIQNVNDCYEKVGLHQAAFTTEPEPTQFDMHKTCSEANTGMSRLKAVVGLAMTFKTNPTKKRKPPLESNS